MKIISFPPELIDKLLGGFREILESGQVAEGPYLKGKAEEFVPGKLSVPVASGGCGIFALLAYHKFVHGKTHVVIQSNTMRALYTVPKLLGMEVVVADSSFEDYLAMNPASLKRQVEEAGLEDKAVVVYSVIGGYLADGLFEINDYCEKNDIPFIVDGAHAHFLADLSAASYLDIAFSFYATKVLPSGEGGLITTANQELFDWVTRFLIYDRFRNELDVGINMRASELSAYFIHTLMTDQSLVKHYRDDRVAIAQLYKRVCVSKGVRFLDPDAARDFNGYKFVILDPREEVDKLGTLLTRYSQTSGVFGTSVTGGEGALPHWCPPTYSSLVGELLPR